VKIPDSLLKAPKSAAGSAQQYDRLMRMYMRAYDGSGSFGWDWPTLRANEPEVYAKLRELHALSRGGLPR
jgi:hypothetical protein